MNNLRRIDIRKAAVVLAFAFVGWALCFAVMGLGMALTSLDNALIVHAAAAPVIFAALSFVYFRRFGYTTPLQTAFAFVGFVIIMDLCLVAIVINRSFAMFQSLIGTWIPFGLIFLSTFGTGFVVKGKNS